ncbi:hypothetical protein KORDIASMS9_03986 [Kordia sp. SMS9]|uniref:hypothetical protein n=1 Tax=Kordia sp. SMS9 TaxID=2282170 RepID=UPI000E10E4B9|nr:hypothetical protein [Kordia sp. SMS9]AXG71729.1 hypothetical protein KORDIASMS9_03986 [Kordia sp. SMS9]
MKKKSLKKLSIGKSIVSEFRNDNVKGGISGTACQPSTECPVPSLGCEPFSIIRANCQLTFNLSCTCG